MNQVQKIHIITFDVPYPPDYGGVIDVYFKIKWLAAEGVKIWLHCFQYGRPKSPELELFCEKVFYYPRAKGLKYTFNKLPYIVATRNSEKLLTNLGKMKAPILFEGLHTCFLIDHPSLRDYKKLVRMHNIEYEYYRNLALAEKNYIKRFHFLNEAKKLEKFESVIKHADTVLTISPSDQAYFKKIHQKPVLITAYHSYDTVTSKPGQGDYFLFHGNLSVAENKKAVLFLVNEVFNMLNIPLIVAGKNPSAELVKRVENLENASIVANPSARHMAELINNAHGCIIPTFQATGLKLKLLASLYTGRYCIVNSLMVRNTGVEELCIVADSARKIKEALIYYAGVEFDEEEIQKREQFLNVDFSNKTKTKRLLNLIVD